jgi:hypothetical protein
VAPTKDPLTGLIRENVLEYSRPRVRAASNMLNYPGQIRRV